MISIIHLPNKEKLDINQKSSYPYNPSYSNSFSLSTSTNAFDPNISGSPPNLFMNSLKNRKTQLFHLNILLDLQINPNELFLLSIFNY